MTTCRFNVMLSKAMYDKNECMETRKYFVQNYISCGELDKQLEKIQGVIDYCVLQIDKQLKIT